MAQDGGGHVLGSSPGGVRRVRLDHLAQPRRHRPQRRARRERQQGNLHAELRLHRRAKLHRHQRIDAELAHLPVHPDGSGRKLEDAGQRLHQDLQQRGRRLLGGQLGDPAAQGRAAARTQGRGRHLRPERPRQARQPAAQLAPGDVGHPGHRHARGKQRGKRVQRPLGGEVGAAQHLGQHLADPGFPRQVAGVADRPPLHGEPGKPGRVPPRGQRLQRRVGGDVGRLARRADDGGDGREQHEQAERVLPGEPVERQGAGKLGPQDGGEAGRVEVGEQRVVQHHRGMQHAGDRPRRAAKVRQHVGQLRVVGHVAGEGLHTDARRGELGQRRRRAGRFGAAPAEQRQGLGAVARQPARRFQPEAGQAAGDDVNAVRRGEAGARRQGRG